MTGLLMMASLIVVMLASSCASTADAERAVESSSDTTTATAPEIPTATPTATVVATPTPTATVEATPTPTTVAAAPDSSAVEPQFEWFIDVLSSSDELTVEEIEQHFSPDFLTGISADQLIGFLPQIYAVARPPYTVESLDVTEQGQAADAIVVGASGGRIAVQMFASAEAPNLIEGVGVVPAPAERTGPVTISALDQELAAIGPQSALGVYEVVGGECVPVHEIRTDAPIVLGSIFKLWVLAALANEVDQGRAAWDETMALTDELRSSANGEIYALETGTEVSLQRLAEAMISTSDNTATDMLLDRVGREMVEDAMVRSGVANPSANIPMMSTGNLFALKFFPNAPNADDYRVLDEAGKRAMLAGLDNDVLPSAEAGVSLDDFDDVPNADGVPIDQPRDLDIEWFATAADLCRTYVHLDALAETAGLEAVAGILEINPGLDTFDRDRWPTIRYKGGSEPGVVATAWWFEGASGDQYVVAGGVSSPDDAINEFNAIVAVGSAIELIE